MQNISIPFENTIIKGDVSSTQKPGVFIFHGAGISERSRYTTLRNFLGEENIVSCAVDFIGHGETGGSMNDSSLEKRTLQAKAVIDSFDAQKPLKIIGSSMSGYNTIKLTELFKVESLVLFVPAVFRTKTYCVPFGPEFSKIIREHESWQDSDAWEILENYTGKLLIISGDKDEVIPLHLTQKIYDSAVHSSQKELILIPGATHAVMNFLEENPKEKDKVFRKIISFLN